MKLLPCYEIETIHKPIVVQVLPDGDLAIEHMSQQFVIPRAEALQVAQAISACIEATKNTKP